MIPPDSLELPRGGVYFLLFLPSAPIQTSPNLHPPPSQSFPVGSTQRLHCFLFFNQDGICLPSSPSQCGPMEDKARGRPNGWGRYRSLGLCPLPTSRRSKSAFLSFFLWNSRSFHRNARRLDQTPLFQCHKVITNMGYTSSAQPPKGCTGDPTDAHALFGC